MAKRKKNCQHLWCQLKTVPEGYPVRWCSLCEVLEILHPRIEPQRIGGMPIDYNTVEGWNPVRTPLRPEQVSEALHIEAQLEAGTTPTEWLDSVNSGRKAMQLKPFPRQFDE